MKCPACSNNMTEKTFGEVVLDVCEGGCGGIWFDWMEMHKFDEPYEGAGEELLDVPRNENLVVDHNKKRSCPHCENIIMMRHFFTPKMQVEIDECPKCGGYWMDQGELRAIRTQFDSEADRDKAAQEYFSQMFDGELDKMSEEGAEQLQKARGIAKMLRFLCPSYYIPGKQTWGAH